MRRCWYRTHALSMLVQGPSCRHCGCRGVAEQDRRPVHASRALPLKLPARMSESGWMGCALGLIAETGVPNRGASNGS